MHAITFRCKKIDAGIYEPLPVAAIERDAANTRVPVYDYPFLHEQLYEWGAARTRAAARRVASRVTGKFKKIKFPPH
jgi:hypothetical protein